MKEDLSSLTQICYILDKLDEPSRKRIIRWLEDSYLKESTPLNGLTGVENIFKDVKDVKDQKARLMLLAQSLSASEQECFRSRDLSKLAKTYGWKFSNLTKVINDLIDLEPALIRVAGKEKGEQVFALTVSGQNWQPTR